MVSYSQKAIKALAFLFRPYNDIDVYVEDTLSRNMYEVLLERMLSGRAKVERVFQLNGRAEVIKECSKDQTDTARRRIYLIDGDYDILTGDAQPKLDYLYRLNVYSSENLVFTEEAFVEVSYECLTNEPREEVRKKLWYKQFMKETVPVLMPLFIINAVVHRLATMHGVQIHLQTTNFPVMNLCSQVGRIPRISKAKVDRRVSEIKAALVKQYKFTQAQVAAEIAEVEKRVPDAEAEMVKYISVKTHILPLIQHHLRESVHFSGTKEELKVRLARYCELNVDDGLLRAVIATSQGERVRTA